jgi:hypothetical protein
MFLCSNAIEFKYPTNDWKRVLSTKTVATSFTSFAEYAAVGLLGTTCNEDVTMVNYENGDGFVHLRAKIPLSEKFRTMLEINKLPLQNSSCLYHMHAFKGTSVV